VELKKLAGLFNQVRTLSIWMDTSQDIEILRPAVQAFEKYRADVSPEVAAVAPRL
jgi:hypothetical protein